MGGLDRLGESLREGNLDHTGELDRVGELLSEGDTDTEGLSVGMFLDFVGAVVGFLVGT